MDSMLRKKIVTVRESASSNIGPQSLTAARPQIRRGNLRRWTTCRVVHVAMGPIVYWLELRCFTGSDQEDSCGGRGRGVAKERFDFRDIAEIIASRLNRPRAGKSCGKAANSFGSFAAFAASRHLLEPSREDFRVNTGEN